MLSEVEEKRIEKFVRDVMDSDSDATPVKPRRRKPASQGQADREGDEGTLTKPLAASTSPTGAAVLKTISQLHGEDGEDKALEASMAMGCEAEQSDAEDERDLRDGQASQKAITWLSAVQVQGDLDSDLNDISRATLWFGQHEDYAWPQRTESQDEDILNKEQTLSLETNRDNADWSRLSSVAGSKNSTFDYEGEVVHSLPEGYGRAWWEGGASYRGTFKKGQMDGDGEMIFKSGDRFRGKFRQGKATASGVLTSKGRRFNLTFEGERDLLNEDLHPDVTEELSELVLTSSTHVITSAVMKGGKGHPIGDFGHIKSCEGKIAFASPFRAHRPLNNSGSLLGKIVVVQRGVCSLHKKLRYVQAAGASAMLVVGIDNATTFNQMLWIVQGPHTEEDDDYDDGENPCPLYVCIPVFYILGNYEHVLTEGAVCRVVFGERTPRTPLNFRLGTVVIPAQTVYADESQSAKDKLLHDFREARKREREEEAVLQERRKASQENRNSAPAIGNIIQNSIFRLGLFRPHSSATPRGSNTPDDSEKLIVTPRPRSRPFAGLNRGGGGLNDVFAVPLMALNEMIAGSCSGMTMGATQKDLASLFGFGGDETPRRSRDPPSARRSSEAKPSIPRPGRGTPTPRQEARNFQLDLPNWMQPWGKDAARR